MNARTQGQSTDRAPHRLAETFHRSLTTKDWSLLSSIMTADVTWTLPGENAISGAAEGIDAVIDRADLIANYGVTFTLEHILLSRSNFALALHNTARRSDAVLDEYLSTVCSVDDGRITRIETFLSDVEGMNAFFVPLTRQGRTTANN
ncbi:nuclear transport factor 2 family protein [Rhodococcoides yunnanense]|uniref:Nuclear transport factor 2 family protein n=1 Tax=Rhodococcoides yunnanense TaxID=278209 RepID=A0ABU4BK30_9NOCA|nr:nuclear transport factor 2 family protein [Rhodococcus yunnanensis]MDV6264577.1 nuclear transport factor 2 family protein [Rhodococcus yunnanensis]